MTHLDHRTPWRYECPHGHCCIRVKDGKFRCISCDRRHTHSPDHEYVVDKKTGRRVFA